jgi:flagellar hook-associated protein 3 FlgL
MRVTSRMMAQRLLDNLERNAAALDRAQGQISSGKRISRPGDDPVAAALAVRLREQRAATGQFRRNIDQSRIWLGATDVALDDAGNTLHRLREVAVQAASDTYSVDDRIAAGKEVEELYQQLLATLNRTDGTGRRLFGGTETTTLPFGTDATGNPVYNGNGATIAREIGAGTTMTLNVPGGGYLALLGQVKDLAAQLAAGTIDPAALDHLDAGIDLVLTQRSETGARLNRLDTVEQGLIDLDIELQRLLAANEDVDYAEALTRYNTQQMVYQAALEVGANVVPMSLLDFLR